MDKQVVQEYFQEHVRVAQLIADRLAGAINDCVDVVTQAMSAGNKVLIMGNGGSAADSQHFAAELVGRFLMERRGLPAIALTTDTSILTAVGNDYGFDTVFRRQIEALAVEGDVVIGISTSGNSENIRLALELASETGCKTVGLLGKDGGRIAPLVDVDLTVPSDKTPHVQEGHIAIIHLVCDLVEKRLFAKG